MPALLRTALVACASVCALAPASALGAAPRSSGGVVLSAAHHTVRLVDRSHRVQDVRVRSTRGLRRGAVVTIRGGRAHVAGHAHRVAFLGRVVRSSKRGAVMRLGDGSIFKLGGGKRPRGHGARAASTVTVDLQGLAPGQTVLVTLSTDAAGNVAIAIKLMPAPAAGEEQGGRAPKTDPGDDQGDDGDPSDCTDDQSSCGDDSTGDDEEIDGTVTAIAADLSSITLDPGDGDPLATIPVDDATLLDGVAVGDDVAVFVDADGNATEIDLFDSSDDPGDDGDT